MDRDDVERLIADHIEHVHFGRAGSAEDIARLEELLQVRLPESYRWLQEKFGYVSVYGLEVFGLGKVSVEQTQVVDETLRRRKQGLPGEYVVITNCDEFVYCIRGGAAPDSPVFIWFPFDAAGVEEYPSLYDYVVFEGNSARDVALEDP